MFPLRFGLPAEFAAVKELLVGAGYSEENVSARFGLNDLHDFRQLAREDGPEEGDALGILIRLFIQGKAVAASQVRDVLPAAGVEQIVSLGLLARESVRESLYSPVIIYPTQSLYFVSDRWSNPDGSDFTLPDDFVYPPNTPNTHRFLGVLSRDPCECLLDLGTGTGIAALQAAASYAKHAWAVDIAERSTKFAEFNSRLNQLGNVTVGQGDLYEPVEEVTFDRIVAHPPYVPVLKKHWTFYDGGEDGEAITRRIIEGLPRYLRPGGKFHCFAMGSDRELPYEQRVREWLGEDASDFDILLIVSTQIDPVQIAADMALKEKGGLSELDTFRALFAKNGVQRFLMANLTIQRRRRNRAPFVVRRYLGAKSTPAQAEWLLRWETLATSPEILELMLNARPVVGRSLELAVTNRLKDENWAPCSYRIRTDYPFPMEGEIEPWMSVVFSHCTGRQTTREIMENLLKDGKLAPGGPPQQFAALLAAFVSRGFLEVADFEVPVEP